MMLDTHEAGDRAQTLLPSATVYPSRVLLIDDQAMIGEAVRRMLASDREITFHYCGDPTQALQIAVDFAPTVILQDLIMPEVDGLTLLRAFRADPTTRDIPIIMLSTKDDPNIKAEAFALGANDYLIKLPNLVELIARIRYHSKAYLNLQASTDAQLARAQACQLEKALQDLRQTQAQLIQTEKMSGLGQMVAGITHEINNPVNFICGNLKYVRDYITDLLHLVHLYQEEYPTPSATIQDYVEEVDMEFILQDLPAMLSSMQVGAERILEIVRSIRNFARTDRTELKKVDLHEGLSSALLILSHRTKQGITLIQNYDGTLPAIECYPGQLSQVFVNILNNAIDALLENEAQPIKQIILTTEQINENQVQIRIQDNGPGIPAEIQGQLFDSFFTTKAAGKGTGLGLAISQQIIEKHHGSIQLESSVGVGTTFIIQLPIEQTADQ